MLLLTVSGNISLTMSFLLSVSHFQLVPYWEKTFRIDLSSPQIGVVDVEDVSHPFSPQIHLSLIIKKCNYKYEQFCCLNKYKYWSLWTSPVSTEAQKGPTKHEV